MAFTLEELEAKLKANPLAKEFYELAGAYQKLGRLQEAKGLCEKGLERYHGNFQARLLMTQIYIAEGKFKEAKRQVDKVLMVVPDNIKANHLAADISYSLGEREAALKYYKVVELFEPGRQGVSDKIEELESAAKVEATAEPKTPENDADPAKASVGNVLEGEKKSSADAAVEAISEEEKVESKNEEGAAIPDEKLESAEGPREFSPGETVKEESAAFQGQEEELSEFGDGELFSEEEHLTGDIGEDTLDSLIVESKGKDGFEEKVASKAEEEQITVENEEEAEAEEKAEETSHEEELAEELLREREERAENSPDLSTLTIAELYEKQGYPEKAIEVYQHILLKEPERRDIRVKIEKLKNGLLGLSSEGEGDVVGYDIKNALRRKRVGVLETWLRKIKEENNV